MDVKIADAGTHPLMQALLAQMEAPKQYVATYRFFRGAPGAETPDSIPDFLELKAEDLSPAAREALEALESSTQAGGDWDGFRWKLTAFLHLQDIFDSPFYDSFERNPRLLFQQYYFYYESLRILRESVLCGLNGFATAATALLRPFLEFSLVQNYFYRSLSEQQSFGELVQYFKTGVTPKTSTLIKKGLPKEDFTRSIRFRLNSHLGGLSESTLHPYHPYQSASQHQAAVYTHSFETLHFWYTTRLVLEAALWVYYVNFPMLFVPVDFVRKFGCNGPVGVFIDEFGGLCVRKSLSDEDYTEFSAYARSQEDTNARVEWYSGRPDLTDQQIEATWHPDENEKYPGVGAAYCQTMARMRAIKGAMALKKAPPQTLPEVLLARTQTLAGWRTMSGRGA